MPAPNRRSRSLRKMHVKVPGGSTAVHYDSRKPKGAKCGSCGALLKGLPREKSTRMAKLSKSSKTVSRPYGGSLCSRCSRQLMVERARV